MDLINLGFAIIIGTIIGSLAILLFQKIKKDQVEDKQDSDVFGEIKLLKEEGANAYDLFKYKNVILTSSSIKNLENRILNEKN